MVIKRYFTFSRAPELELRLWVPFIIQFIMHIYITAPKYIHLGERIAYSVRLNINSENARSAAALMTDSNQLVTKVLRISPNETTGSRVEEQALRRGVYVGDDKPINMRQVDVLAGWLWSAVRKERQDMKCSLVTCSASETRRQRSYKVAIKWGFTSQNVNNKIFDNDFMTQV